MREQQIESIEIQRPRPPASFKTERGSVYTYGEDGRATRFKTVEGKVCSPQDVTVFADIEAPQQMYYLDAAYKHMAAVRAVYTSEYMDMIKNWNVYIFQRTPDGGGAIVDHLDDIEDASLLNVGVFDGIPGEGGKCLVLNKASLAPVEGNTVVELSHDGPEESQDRFYHIGHKVVEIIDQE